MAGGVGGSRFARGVRRAFPDAELTIIANTADDITVHGLRVCPDLDTIMYALGDGHDPVRGWGRRDESWAVLDEPSRRGSRSATVTLPPIWSVPRCSPPAIGCRR